MTDEGRRGQPHPVTAWAEGDAPLRRDTLHAHAKRRLREVLAAHVQQGLAQLPPEDELSRQLGLSRPTVRSALLSLQKEGVVQRVHGRGTFVNRHALRVRANVAVDRPFVELLESAGHEVRIRIRSLTESRLAEADAERLEVDQGTYGCRITRIFEASGQPAVLSIDEVPTPRLVAPLAQVAAEESTFEFVRRWTDTEIRYSVAEIVPVLATSDVAEWLDLAPGAPVLLLSHLHLDLDDVPIALTRAYIDDRHLRFGVVRSYLDV